MDLFVKAAAAAAAVQQGRRVLGKDDDDDNNNSNNTTSDTKSSSDDIVHCLLTLPKADFSIDHQNSNINKNDNPNDSTPSIPPTLLPSLVLLQLPIDWSVSDLSNAHFVANDNYKNNKNNNNSSNNQEQQHHQVSLVVDSKQTSFTVFRVETSNALIVVPPLSPSSALTTSTTTKNNDIDIDIDHNYGNANSNVNVDAHGVQDALMQDISIIDSDCVLSTNTNGIDIATTNANTNATTTTSTDTTKKRKLVLPLTETLENNNPMTPIITIPTLYSRLITRTVKNQQQITMTNNGGSSFLQLRTKSIKMKQLEQLLNVWNPYNTTRIVALTRTRTSNNDNSNSSSNDNNDGTTNNSIVHGAKISQLAMKLQVAKHQVWIGLQLLRAFPFKQSTLRQPIQQQEEQHQHQQSQQQQQPKSGDIIRRLDHTAENEDDDDDTDTDTDEMEYIILSEEVWKICNEAIVSTLIEQYEYTDVYSTKPISIQLLTRHVIERISIHDIFPNIDNVVQFCIRHLVSTVPTTTTSPPGNSIKPLDAPLTAVETDDDELIQLSLQKVAVCVAQRLFCRHSKPWDETVFISRWQSELPGINNKVDPSMLQGVAIRILYSNNEDDTNNNNTHAHNSANLTNTASSNCTTSNSQFCWKYLPKESLPYEDECKYIDILFREKESWTLQELQPYLDWYVLMQNVPTEDVSTTHASILLRYMKTITSDDDSIATKCYVKK